MIENIETKICSKNFLSVKQEIEHQHQMENYMHPGFSLQFLQNLISLNTPESIQITEENGHSFQNGVSSTIFSSKIQFYRKLLRNKKARMSKKMILS
jgi:hypothetical protein